MNTADLLNAIDPQRMRKDVEKLASFHTRNTNSPTLEEAAEWLAAQYSKLQGVQTELMRYKVAQSPRVPKAIEPPQVIARKVGSSSRWLAIGGHLDSLNLQVDPITGRAPGANDDASGTVVALEVLRALSSADLKCGIMGIGFTGEEQGLLGAKALAERCRNEDLQLEAVFNNDTVGSSSNKNGQKNTEQVRIFSDDPWALLPGSGESARRTNPLSRELARFIEWITRDRIPGFSPKLVFRKDRFGRGGDHTPFHEKGFPAVRFVEVHEEYTRQHTPDDLVEHMDFEYLANVAKLNALALLSLAQADEAPQNVRIVRDQSHDTHLTWKAKPDVCYTVYWRETTSPIWQDSLNVESNEEAIIKRVNKDDHEFAVGAAGGLPIPAV